MEKLNLAIILVGVVFSANTSFSDVLMGWEKMKERVWKIAGNRLWYKLDQNFCLWTSFDGKIWDKSLDNCWKDYSQRIITIKDQKLVWSEDNGNNWQEVPLWKFQADENLYYQFGKDWSLWLLRD
jgi:hypothetical protein